jgi:hypothetical protein
MKYCMQNTWKGWCVWHMERPWISCYYANITIVIVGLTVRVANSNATGSYPCISTVTGPPEPCRSPSDIADGPQRVLHMSS